MDEEEIEDLSSLSEGQICANIVEWTSDDKKIEAMEKYITGLNYKRDIILSLSSVERKIELLMELGETSYYIRDIVYNTKFENDEQRIRVARVLEDEGLIYEVLKGIEDDEKKFESISLLTNNVYIESLIHSFKSDEYKIKALKEYIYSQTAREGIIKSLSTNERKIENLYLLDDVEKKTVVESIVFNSDEEIISLASRLEDEELASIAIKKIKNDEIKIEALKLIKDEEKRALIIATINDDEIKLEQSEKISNEENRAIIISSLSSDEKKIEQLKEISNEENRATIVSSFDSDEKKIEQLERISIEENKTQIIISLGSDELKIKQLENIVNEKNKTKIIVSFDEDDNKLLYLDKFKREALKKDILVSLSNSNLKADLLDKISDDYYKAEIITSMASNADFKIKQLEKIDDEFAKALVIKSLYDDRIKIQQLSNIKNDYCKAVIIESLKLEKNQTKLVETINDKYLKELLGEVINSKKYGEKTGFSCVSRSKLKEKFLDKNRKYTQIGLDKRMTIGMEIESEGALSSLMLSLKKIAISEKDGKARGWDAKTDGSLNNGVEIVSPILSDNKEDIEDLYMICSMLKNGQRASENCGGHIHIGADYLTSKEAYINLFEIWGNAEKIIYQMCNENGDIPRYGIQDYAPPISPKFNDAIEKGSINLENEDDLNDFIAQVQEIQGDRYSGLNLLNINNGKNTIEFRIPNGTINPDVWIENARLFGRIVQMSQSLAEIEKKSEHSEEEDHLIELYNNLKQDIPEEKKMEILLELLFTEEERNVYRERYFNCSKKLKELPDEGNPIKNVKFSGVDIKKKHNVGEYHNVAVNNRSESTNEAVIETRRGIQREEVIDNNRGNTED